MTDVELRVTADLDQATKEVAGFRKEYAGLVDSIEKPIRQMEGLQKTQQAAKAAATEFYAARQRVQMLQDALAKVRGPSDALAKSLSGARVQADAAAKAVERQKKKIDDQRVSVEKARAAYAALRASMASGGASESAVAGARQELAEQIELLRRQQAALGSQRTELAATRRSVKELSAAYEQAAQPVRLIERDLRGAEYALSRATKEFDLQKQKVSEQRRELRAAGVDTRKLADEQRRLQSELQNAMAAGRADVDLQRQTVNFQRAIHQAAQARLAQQQQQATNLQQAIVQVAQAKMAEQQRHAAAVQGIRAQSAALKQQALAQRQASLEAARSNFGVTQARAARQELVSLRQQFDLLRNSGTLSTRELAMAQRQLKQRIAETKRELKGLEGGFSLDLGGGRGGGGKSGAAGAAAAIATAAATAGAVAIAQGSDEIGRLDTRLRLATKSQEEFNRAQFELDRIADLTQGDVSSLVELYGRLQRPLRDVGLGQKETLETVEAVSLGLKIGGASAAEAEGAVRQLSQALASGVLRGDEFNSVLEQSDRVAGALADELGVTVGQLREMAKNGELTTETVVKAFGNQLPQLRKEFAQFAPELTAAVTRAGNELKLYWGRQAKESGVTDYFASVINEYAKGVNRAAEAEKQLFDERKTQFDMHAAEMKAIATRAATDAKEILEQQLKDTESALKRQVEAERKASGDLDKAKKAQLDTQKRYKDALASLNTSAPGQADLGQATALKAGARQALQAGNVEEAKRQAQAALAIIQELAKAGENTYGFSGFIKELQAIESSADASEVEDAEKALGAAKQQALDTRAVVEELKQKIKDLKVIVSLSPEDEQKLLNDVAALAKKAGILLTVPMTVTMPELPAGAVPSPAAPPIAPAFARGGILRGKGTGTSDSNLAWLSNGEGILNARAVQHYGADLVHRLNRLSLPRYATGGVHGGGLSLPPMPQLAPALQQQLDGPNFPDLGRMVLEMGGQSYTVYAPPDQASELKLAARKFGRTSPR